MQPELAQMEHCSFLQARAHENLCQFRQEPPVKDASYDVMMLPAIAHLALTSDMLLATGDKAAAPQNLAATGIAAAHSKLEWRTA